MSALVLKSQKLFDGLIKGEDSVEVSPSYPDLTFNSIVGQIMLRHGSNAISSNVFLSAVIVGQDIGAIGFWCQAGGSAESSR